VLVDGGFNALLRGGNVHITSTSSETTKQGLHLRDEIPTAIGPARDRGINAGLQDPFCFFRLLYSNQCAAQGQMRGDMHRVELDGNTEMFRRFLEAAALLKNPVA